MYIIVLLEGCLVGQPTLKVGSGDRIKLSLLHRSGNVSYYK
jgi:hypothetical protein